VTLSIPRRDPDLAELPLSFGQEQLWFLEQFAPGTAVNTVTRALRLTGPLDAGALTAAVTGLAARHEILRTRLVSVDGTPRQVVDPPSTVDIPTVDLSAMVPEQREEHLTTLAGQEARRPFRLDTGPLLRATLVRHDAGKHVLLVSLHHTVADGWSYGVLLRELSALYQQTATGEPADLPELPIQFADYALWERKRLQGTVLDELTTYWREALAGADPLQLPTDRSRPPVQSFDGAVAALTMGASTLAGLRALSQRHGTTLFVTLLAAFEVLLHRYSGQDDFVIGTASANRSRPELTQLIGYLVNTLPIRANLAGNPRFEDHLRQVKEVTLQAYAHQELPLTMLVDAMQVPRDARRSPVFQVMFTVDDGPAGEWSAGDLIIRTMDVEPLSVTVDLDVTVRAWGELDVRIGYATALFDEATVRRLLRSLRALLAGIVADPTRPVRQLPIMSDEDLHQELAGWNTNHVAYPETTLTELFEQQARQHPDAPAAIFESERLTYTQLNRAAHRISTELRKRGVSTESLVGIHMRPSLHRLAAILGVLKAGGAYLPLDPDYPAERLAFMLKDASAALVLADSPDEPTLTASDIEVMIPQHSLPLLATDPGADPEPAPQETRPDPAGAAYVIYTSGSTGRPKGVVVEHRQVANFAQGMIDALGLDTGHRVLQFASLNFDVSVMDMFLALCSGAAAVFSDRETLLSPQWLVELLGQERVTYACLPPALLDLLDVLDLLGPESLPHQQIVISAGEALPPRVARAWHRPGLRIYNGYGLTETAVGGIMRELSAGDLDQPPIGLPIPNYRAYVLDPDQQPVPPGVVGELYMGGTSIARGYLNRPQLTHQRFLPDPFSPQPDARMYRTGDLVRRRNDGNLLYLGRIDDQVKLHGLRIELGEIETALTTHPAIAQAVAAIKPGPGGLNQLIGYIRRDPQGPDTSLADLQQHLAQWLPGYLIPAQLMVMNTFPVNPSGKIDRSALPIPETTGAAAANTTPPRTVLELVLVDAYARLLGRDSVGAEESFFEAGGNSLQAVRLVSELRGLLAIDAHVTAIFLAPTPRQLAVLLVERHGLTDSELTDQDVDGHR
jgi:amino acid adenylation domain-containing protein